MKILQLKCPNCNANLQVSDDKKQIKCEYCGMDILLDDEKIKVEHTVTNESFSIELEKADTFLYKLKYYDKAFPIYLRLIDECPWKPEVWEGLIRSMTDNFTGFNYKDSVNTESILDLDKLFEYVDNYLKVQEDSIKKDEFIKEYSEYKQQLNKKIEENREQVSLPAIFVLAMIILILWILFS